MTGPEKQQLGQEAINVLSLLYHHGQGKQWKENIDKLSEELPDWRQILKAMPAEKRESMRLSIDWDRGDQGADQGGDR